MKTKFIFIVEVDGNSFSEIMRLGKLNIGWDRCPVYEYFDVVRCYNCGGFGHIGKVCKLGKACLNCGESGHLKDSCKNSSKCANCEKTNRKSNLNLDVHHSIFSHSCCVLKSQEVILKKRTCYSS